MKPNELMEAWKATGEELVTFPVLAFAGLSVPVETKDFLGAIGLPASAAPFLGFRPPRTGPLPTAAQFWRLEDGDLEGFFVIGSNGSGDSIAIDREGTVFYLNHDAGFSPCYINKDVLALSETLLRYQQLVAEALACNGPDALLDGQVPAESVSALRVFLAAHDHRALAEGSMWSDELDQLHG